MRRRVPFIAKARRWVCIGLYADMRKKVFQKKLESCVCHASCVVANGSVLPCHSLLCHQWNVKLKFTTTLRDSKGLGRINTSVDAVESLYPSAIQLTTLSSPLTSVSALTSRLLHFCTF